MTFFPFSFSFYLICDNAQFPLQRHFCVFALSFPGVDALKTIYLSILSGHLANQGIGGSISKLSERLTEAAIALNSKVRHVKWACCCCCKRHLVFI